MHNTYYFLTLDKDVWWRTEIPCSRVGHITSTVNEYRTRTLNRKLMEYRLSKWYVVISEPIQLEIQRYRIFM